MEGAQSSGQYLSRTLDRKLLAVISWGIKTYFVKIFNIRNLLDTSLHSLTTDLTESTKFLLSLGLVSITFKFEK